MDQSDERTMAQVVVRLRRTSPEATSEIGELYLAVREIALNSRQLERNANEAAAEVAALAAVADGVIAQRLKNLAAYMATLRSGAEGQAAALSELRSGIESWGLFVP
jgi:hypothetical protein